MPPKNIRTERRKNVQRECWVVIDSDANLKKGVITDISHGGCRLVFVDPSRLPDPVTLLFTPDGRVARQASVVWRSPNDAGLRFLGKDSWSLRE